MLGVRFILVICLTGILNGQSIKDPYISIELSTSWQVLCKSLTEFRSNLASITEASKILIVVRNANENCKTGGAVKGPIKVHVSILKKGGKGETDIDLTLKMRDKVKTVTYIGTFRVRYVEARNIPVQSMKFSTETILIVIGIVLAIYLIGYFLILGVQSYSSTDTEDRPLSFILATENKYFVEGVRRHKSRQYNVSKKAARKSIDNISSSHSYTSRDD